MPALSPAVAHHRARVGAITRAVRAGERPSADLDNARRDLAWEKLAEHAESVVAGWPKPTDIQLQRIAALLERGRCAARRRSASRWLQGCRRAHHRTGQRRMTKVIGPEATNSRPGTNLNDGSESNKPGDSFPPVGTPPHVAELLVGALLYSTDAEALAVLAFVDDEDIPWPLEPDLGCGSPPRRTRCAASGTTDRRRIASWRKAGSPGRSSAGVGDHGRCVLVSGASLRRGCGG